MKRNEAERESKRKISRFELTVLFNISHVKEFRLDFKEERARGRGSVPVSKMTVVSFFFSFFFVVFLGERCANPRSERRNNGARGGTRCSGP